MTGNTSPLPAFDNNDSAPQTVQSGMRYTVPTTAAESTITLPRDAPDGAVVAIFGDGTANGHAVTVRDGGGSAPVAITATLAASKPFVALCCKNGGVWTAITGVHP